MTATADSSVTITGTPTQGQTLTASNNIVDTDGITSVIRYQWKADGFDIGTPSTANTLLLGLAQAGKRISVTASYTTVVSGTIYVPLDSTPTGYIDTLPTGVVTIAGTAAQGKTLTVSDTIADLDGIVTLIEYQWKQNGVDIPGKLGSSLTLDQSHVGKIISVTASYTDKRDNVDSVTSAATALVANVNDTPTGGVTIDGEATQGKVLTANNNFADSDGLGAITYQWQAGGTNITGAAASTITLAQAQVGKVITVTASYADGFKFAESISSGPTAAVANVNDSPTGSVTIAGITTQGKVLTASNTIVDVDGLGTISYQWKADGINIDGATARTLTLGQAEVGKIITVTASYTDLLGTLETLTSVATASVANVNDSPVGSVTISGLATQDQVLSATNTLADVDGIGDITYQWKANGVNISGATSSNLTLTQVQVGKVITVAVSYSDAFGQAESVSSTATNGVRNINDAPAGAVTITGDAMIGQILSASNTLADMDGLGTITYQWKADGNSLSGATSGILALTQAHIGKVMSVTASYTDLFGTSEAVTSAETNRVTKIDAPPTGNVTITGTATQTSTLTATNTLSDVDGLGTINYQWKADGTDILDATSTTLTLSQAQVGKIISVAASYIDGLGKLETATSVATPAVANVNDLPTGKVSISGNPKQGETIGITNTLVDIDGIGNLSYQWNANGTPIANATTNTLTLGLALVGKVITVKSSYVDGWGTFESVISDPTSVVTATPSAPLIGGVPSALQHLTMGEPICLNNIVVSDAGADSTTLVLTLYANNGVFSILSNPGSPMPALKLTGTAEKINATLKYLNFTASSEGSAGIQAQLTNPAVNLSTLVSLQFNSSVNSMPGITQIGGLSVAGDGNGDGIVDTAQTDVSSAIVAKSSNPGSSVGTQATYVTLVADSAAGKMGHPLHAKPTIHGLIQTDVPNQVPTSLAAPLGAFEFTAYMNSTDPNASFSLYVDNDLGINGYWVRDVSGYWTNLATSTNNGNIVLEGGKARLDFHVVDGSAADGNGAIDGIIVNAGIPGFLPLSLIGQTPTSTTFNF